MIAGQRCSDKDDCRAEIIADTEIGLIGDERIGLIGAENGLPGMMYQLGSDCRGY